MSELSGLAAIRAYKKKMAEQAEERETRRAQGDGPKVQYLKLADGQAVKVRFLQEMDTEGKNYDPNKGIGMGAVEHTGIDDKWTYRGICTIEDGQCWPCEQFRGSKKGEPGSKYVQKRNYYINALVDFGNGEEPQTWILSRGLNSSFVADLMEETDETGTIMGKTFKVTRRGTGTDTSWSLRHLASDTTFDSVNVDEAHVFKIEKDVLRHVPYETDYEKKMFSQERYYTQNAGEWKREFIDGSEGAEKKEESSTEDVAVGHDVMKW